MAKQDGPDKDNGMEGTEGQKEDNSNVWTASRTNKLDKNEADTRSKLNSNCTLGPTQNQPEDKTNTKSWHKTNTEVALDEDQTEMNAPINNKKAADIDTGQKHVTSDKKAYDPPEFIARELNNIPTVRSTITRELRKPPTRQGYPREGH